MILPIFYISLGVVLLAFGARGPVERWMGRLETAVASRASHWLAPFAVLLTILAVDVVLAAVIAPPEPHIHDEFSYLLSADTFLHGRLTNPPHPMWRHFETIHELMQPTYNSKYPPMQGLFLALGGLLGRPLFGVWLSTVLAGGAIFWMLRAGFSRPWSLVGMVLALANRQVLEWNWSFWGGTVALLGGALLFGGLWRNLKSPATRPSVAMGVGAGVLALCRPFEGVLICALAGIVLVMAGIKRRPGWRAFTFRLILPLIGTLLPFLIFDGYYNYRVTGNALTMPYAVYEKTYSNKSVFLLGSDRDVVIEYHNDVLRHFYTREGASAEWHRTAEGYSQRLGEKLGRYGMYFWNGAAFILLIPLLACLWCEVRARFVVLFFLIPFAVSVGLVVYTWPHYTAPIFPLLLVATLFALQRLYTWHQGADGWGRRVAWSLVVFIGGANFLLFANGWRPSEKLKEWHYARAKTLADLSRDGKKKLLIVRYIPSHNPDREWVYNEADIDAATVVWARDLGPEENRKLLDYFKDRAVFYLDVDDKLQRTE